MKITRQNNITLGFLTFHQRSKWLSLSLVTSIFLIYLGIQQIPSIYAEELKILESQLNKNSITGILQNQYDYTVGSIVVRAEFYDKEDGHLVGVRDFGYTTKPDLEPNEKSSFKIVEEIGFSEDDPESFPNTEFVVKANGIEISDDGLFGGLIAEANKLTKALNNVTSAVEEYKNKSNDINLTQPSPTAK